MHQSGAGNLHSALSVSDAGVRKPALKVVWVVAAGGAGAAHVELHLSVMIVAAE